MLRVQLQEADYLTANRLHNRRQLKQWLLFIASSGYAIVMGVILTETDFLGGPHPAGAGILFGAVIAMWGFIAYLRLVLVPRKARQVFRQQKSLQRPMTLTWDEAGLDVEAADGKSRMPWEDFVGWQQGDTLFLLYMSDVVFRMVPKRDFPDSDSVTRFGRLIAEKIGPEGIRARKV